MNIEDLLSRLQELDIGPEDYHRYEIKLLADGESYEDVSLERVDGRRDILLSSPSLDDELYDERNSR